MPFYERHAHEIFVSLFFILITLLAIHRLDYKTNIIRHGKTVYVDVIQKDNCNHALSDQINNFRFVYQGKEYVESILPIDCDSFAIGSHLALKKLEGYDLFLFPNDTGRDEKFGIGIFAAFSAFGIILTLRQGLRSKL